MRADKTCSRDEACSASTAAARISVGSVAALALSTEVRNASIAEARSALPCRAGIRDWTAAPTLLKALACTCSSLQASVVAVRSCERACLEPAAVPSIY